MSDILLSTSRQDVGGLLLPSRETPTQLTDYTMKLADLRQKMLIRNRTMIQWSGSYLNARIAAKAILKASDDGLLRVNPLDVIRDVLEESESSGLSMIYHFSEPDGTLDRICHHCNENEGSGSLDLISSGSGEYSFLHDQYIKFAEASPDFESIRLEIILKILMTLVMERYSDDTLAQLYGGWFEIAFKSTDAFEKLPYAIKLWGCDGSTLGSGGPGIFGWYYDKCLVLTRFQKFDINGREQEKLSHHWINDFLHTRTKPSSPPSNTFKSEMVLHAVLGAADCQFMFLDSKPNDETMYYYAGKEGFGYHIGQGFKDFLLEGYAKRSQSNELRIHSQDY